MQPTPRSSEQLRDHVLLPLPLAVSGTSTGTKNSKVYTLNEVQVEVMIMTYLGELTVLFMKPPLCEEFHFFIGLVSGISFDEVLLKRKGTSVESNSTNVMQTHTLIW